MIVLGLNTFHADSAAALLVDGQVVTAIEEERFRRVKHWAGFPMQAIVACLKQNSMTLSDVDYVAINTDPRASMKRKLMYMATGKAGFDLIWEKLLVRAKRESIESHLTKLKLGKQKNKIVHVEHHHAHLASAFYVSPFYESVVVSVDGFGDFSSGAWASGNASTIDIRRRNYFPHSLGLFYQAMTQYLGFPKYGDEYKVMGLAPYGKPRYQDEMSDLISISGDKYTLNLRYFSHHRRKAGFLWNDGEPVMDCLFSPSLVELLGPARNPDDEILDHHRDIACSVQLAYEETFFSLLQYCQRSIGSLNLSLAGGCAMNSVANGKIYVNTEFRNVFVQPASGDAGGAIGAALVAANSAEPRSAPLPMCHAYLGPRFENEQILASIEANRPVIEEAGCKISYAPDKELIAVTANAIAEGKIVGWFAGNMEWGPRALGNRSILGDPRRQNMKDILNTKIKRRESFRPFAPSVLREVVGDWFETDDDVPFMCKVFKVKPTMQDRIPAVTHVDGTGRLQTVTRVHNLRYYDLIKCFGEITGVPLLLNTSFNENEPIVCKPEEALDCFLRTDMDLLIMENYMLARY